MRVIDCTPTVWSSIVRAVEREPEVERSLELSLPQGGWDTGKPLSKGQWENLVRHTVRALPRPVDEYHTIGRRIESAAQSGEIPVGNNSIAATKEIDLDQVGVTAKHLELFAPVGVAVRTRLFV